ncbi:MAG: FRG domain-containing protein [Treponema sp.]|nr:FRG domain-containing protein [Treponema sp.]
MAINFGIGKIEEENKYFEVNITDDDKAYYPLFNFFLNPQSILGDEYVDKIFKNVEYQANHRLIEKTTDFFDWNGWLFRGQRNSAWKLETAFERLMFGKAFERDYYELEMGMLRDFRRKAFNYTPNLEAIDDISLYEWIANFQHYGGKTRFLDATFSFFVALFFAVSNIEFEKPEENKKKSFSIWCFNRMWIEKRYKDFLPDTIRNAYQEDPYGKSPMTQKMVLDYVPDLKLREKEGKEGSGEYKNAFLSVINMTPFKMNQRLINQRGSFLFPTNIYQSFEKNLFAMIDPEKNPNDIYRVIKLNVEYDNRSLSFILNLLDMMNTNYNVLYNSFEGLCQQINFKTRLPNDALTIPPGKGML